MNVRNIFIGSNIPIFDNVSSYWEEYSQPSAGRKHIEAAYVGLTLLTASPVAGCIVSDRVDDDTEQLR